jgi:hypothetical protein
MPHPYLVPVSPKWSRSTHNSGVPGSASTSIAFPFTVSFMMASCKSWLKGGNLQTLAHVHDHEQSHGNVKAEH